MNINIEINLLKERCDNLEQRCAELLRQLQAQKSAIASLKRVASTKDD